jgi:hypothetical protein
LSLIWLQNFVDQFRSNSQALTPGLSVFRFEPRMNYERKYS